MGWRANLHVLYRLGRDVLRSDPGASRYCRQLVEPLEARTLLAGIPVASQATPLLNSVNSVANTLNNVGNDNTKLPLANRSLRQLNQASNPASPVGTPLSNALNDPTASNGKEQLRDAIFSRMQPYLADRNAPAGVDRLDVDIPVYDEATATYKVVMTLDYDNPAIALPLNTGLPGLPISFSSGQVLVSTGIHYTDFAWGLNSGVYYFDTTPVDELTVRTKMALDRNVPVQGAFGFFQVTATDQATAPAPALTALTGSTLLDVQTVSTLPVPTNPRFSGNAHAGLNVQTLNTTPINGKVSPPDARFGFRLDWNFTNANPATSFSNWGGPPAVYFDNVEINLGGFLNRVMQPMVQDLQKMTRQFQPIFDVLKQRIPILSDLSNLIGGDDINLIKLNQVIDATGIIPQGIQNLLNLTLQLGQTADSLNQLNIGPGSPVIGAAWLPMGSFDLSNNPPLQTLPSYLLNQAAENWTSLATHTNTTVDFNLIRNWIQTNVAAPFGGQVVALLDLLNGNASQDGAWVNYPILDNPQQGIDKLLLAQKSDLVVATFRLQNTPLNLQFQLPSPIPAADILFTAQMTPDIYIRAGYDTYGMREFVASGSPDPIMFRDGLWFDPTSHARAEGFVGAGLIFNAPVLEPFIQGGITGNFRADPITGLTLPDPTRAHVYVDLTDKPYLANVTGNLDVALRLGVKIGVDLGFPIGFVGIEPSIDLGLYHLLNFNVGVPNPFYFPASPIAVLDPNTHILTLNMGSAQRRADRGIATSEINEVFNISALSSPSRGTTQDLIVSAFGVTGNYTGVQGILAQGEDGNDVIIIAADVTVDATINGGDGNDQISYFGSGDVSITGDAGDDQIIGGSGNNTLQGGIGNDNVTGGTGQGKNNIVDGGADDDRVISGPGPATLIGGTGNDQLVGNAFDDTIDGGDGLDTIYGGAGNDSITGGQGADKIDAEAGNDTIFGGTEDDLIQGGDGNDSIAGEDGFDTVIGGLGADTIDGGNQNDIIIAALQDNNADAAGNTINAGAGDDSIAGSSQADSIEAGSGNDAVLAYAGNDTVSGSAGLDSIYGGDGNDSITGGDDADSIFGELGNDTLRGGNGLDVIYGSDGMDLIFGDADADQLYGDAADDSIEGGLGNDSIQGGDGNDSIFGQDNDDQIAGGNQNDLIFGGLGNDAIDGNAGDDTIQGNDGNDTISGLAGRDNIRGDAGNDSISGGTESDFIRGGSGNDTVSGDADPDVVYGEDGADLIFGNAGGDRIDAGDGNDTVWGFSSSGTDDNAADTIRAGGGADSAVGGGGPDWIDGGAGVDTLLGNDGDDTLLAGSGVGDSLSGGNGNDRIVGSDDGPDSDPNFADLVYFGDQIDGGAGKDTIFGLGGADLIIGGAHSDYIDSGAGGDSVSGGAGDDFIYAGVNGVTGDSIDAGADNDTVWGSDANDTIIGNDGNDSILAQGGADSATGDAGDDIIDSGAGSADFASGGAGNDQITDSGGANNTLSGDAGNDTITGSDDGSDSILGAAGRDRLSGRAGNDTVSGGTEADTIDGGAGDDLISGDAGADLLVGGINHDTIYGHSSSGAGDDNSVDSLYGDAGTNGNEPGSGRDLLFGQGGNDLLYGEGDLDSIVGGAGASNLISYGAGGSTTPEAYSAPSPTPPPSIQNVPSLTLAGATLPSGIDYRGRWAELASSATKGGLSNSISNALEPSIAIAPDGTKYVAWVDGRRGNYEIYVARYTAGGGWQQLAGSASEGGISNSLASSRRPSIAIDGAGNPMVAWAEATASGSDIKVSRYNGASWVALGSNPGTGQADRPVLVNTSAGAVVSWINTSGGIGNVYSRQFNGTSWIEYGAIGSASGLGVSNNAAGVLDFAAATDGTKVAITWSALDAGGVRQIYLREFGGATWAGLGTSFSGSGLSNTAGDSNTPTVAYLAGTPYVAWQDNSTGLNEIFAAKFSGGNWAPAGASLNVSQTNGDATQPRLSAGGSTLNLVWGDDLFVRNAGTSIALYGSKTTGAAFTPEVVTDASGMGASPTRGVADVATASGSSGRPSVAWADASNTTSQVLVRASDQAATNVYTATTSVQSVLDSNALGAGDVIVLTGASAGFTVSAADAGVTIIGQPGSSVTGAVTINAANVTLQNLSIAGTLTVAGASFTARESTLAAVQINGVSGVQIVKSTTGLITVSGGASNAAIEHNTAAGLTIGAGGATGISVRDNVFTATVSLANAASGTIRQNRINATGTGLNIAAAFTGSIDDNDITGTGVGVNYAASAALGGNRITGATTGVIASVSGPAAFGFVGSTTPNDIYGNTTGVTLTGAGMQNQHVFSNTTGVTGTGALGGTSLDLANLIELNTTGVNFTGPIQYNRIARNTTGIAASANQLIAHNLVYQNTLYGLRVTGRANVRIFSNSFHTATGDNVRLDGSSNDVQLVNNILVSDGGGYDIYVDPNSRAGFFSDYNLLHSTGTGLLVRWLKDFNDILDWQSDVALYDLHSIGRTVVNPDRSDPGFMNPYRDDFRLFSLSAGQRGSATPIDAGASFADQAVDVARVNRLTNPSFESGVSGWTVSAGGTTQSSNPTPWDGSSYFYPGSIAVGSAEQTINLVSAGYTTTQLDSQDLVLTFGGRVRTLGESTQIILSFLDGGSATISSVTLSARNVGDRWELLGDRRAIPTGTRSIKFRFEATRQSGSPNDSYLDGAFVYVESENGAPDLGAYGNTAADATQVAPPHLALRSPDLYTDLILTKPIDVTWDSFGNTGDSPVKIDLYQDTADGPAFLQTIIAATPDTGHFTWIPQSSGLAAGLSNVRLQLSLASDNISLDRAAEASTVPQAGTNYYLDDASNANDEYTPAAVGSNRNTGKLTTSPKPLLTTLLRIYDLDPTDVVNVDTGNYQQFQSAVLSGAAGVGDDEGSTITGPTDPAKVASISPLGFTTGAVIEINTGDFTTLTRLTLGGGSEYGLWIRNSSTNNVATRITQTGATLDGIRVESDSTPQTFDRLEVSGNGRTGASLNSATGSISNSRFYNNTQYGLYIASAGAGAIYEANEAYGNAYGIAILTAAPAGTPVTFGNTDLTQSRGNKIHDNTGIGVFAQGNVIVAGNAIYGQGGSNAHGIELALGASATKNVVYSNTIGIYGTGAMSFNRVFNNATYGIALADNSSLISGNVVYSNGTGIASTQGFSNGPNIQNNLIYSNASRGISIINARNATIFSNTIYQPSGNDIEIDTNGAVSSTNLQVVNNILHAGSGGGYAIKISQAMQSTLISDYNLFYTTGPARIGTWQNLDQPTLAAWRSTSFQDANSLLGDPLYVDFDGADNLLGYTAGADHGGDDNLHEQSLNGSFKGASLAPVIDNTSGLPVSQAGSYSNDIASSPAIDRGQPTFSFANEPAPNGGFVNIGAYANTNQASRSPAQYTLVIRPNGGETGVIGQPFGITWRQENIGSSTVKIELLHSPSLTLETVISASAPNTGSFTWNIPGGTPAGSDYVVRITRLDAPAISDVSDATFALATASPIYYVNDSTVQAGDWTTAPGSDLNDGLTPATPKATIQGMLAAYDFGPGDIIRVDRGTYNLTTDIVVPANDTGVKIVGFTGADLTSGWSASVLGDGPTHYYRLGEGSGSNAIDSSGQNHTATYENGIVLGSTGALPGDANTAATFDGVDDDVRLPSGFQTFANGFSFEAWINPSAVTNFQNIFDLGNGQANNNIILYRSATTNNLVFTVYGGTGAGGSVTASNALLLRQWQHIAVTMTSSGAAKIYRNGLLLASGNVNVPASVTRTSNFLGRDNWPSDGKFAGRMDEVAFYDKVLTDTQIAARNALVAGPAALINRQNTGSGIALDLANADNVTIQNLAVTGAFYGIRLASGADSDGVFINGNSIFGNGSAGVDVETSNDTLVISQNKISGNGQYGVVVNSAVGVLINDNDIWGNTTTNVSLTGNGHTVSNNRLWGAQRSVGATGAFNAPTITISGNDIHDDSSYGIEMSGNSVLAVNNTIYNHAGSFGYGIRMSSSEARGNVIFSNSRGVSIDNGLVTGNRIFNNSIAGVETTYDAVVQGNQIYGNATGILSSRATNAAGQGPYLRNNLVYQNSVTGIRLDGGRIAEIAGNTVYQPAGNGITLNGSGGTFQDTIKNNIVVVGSGTGLAVANDVHTGLVIDYNDVYVTGGGSFASYGATNYATRPQWYFDLGYDHHSLSVDPQFVDIDGADNALGYAGGIDRGADDNFSLAAGSPAIDAGDPQSYFVSEPLPSGARVNLGHQGNTAQATTSPAKTLQVLDPNGLEKLTVGVPYPVSFASAGLRQRVPVLLMNAGGSSVGSWLYTNYTVGAVSSSSIANAIDLSLVTNPAPQSVYQQWLQGTFGTNGALSFNFPLLDGAYTLRLHFIEPQQTTAGSRVMDVKLNGSVVTSNYDPFVAAGNARFKATTLSYTVNASGGSGLSLDLVSKVNNYPIVSGIEITAATPSGSANPTANIDVSLNNGASWSSIATSVPIDSLGRGTFNWTPTTPSSSALIRVTDSGSPATDTSDTTFVIDTAGTDYYINDGSTAGDVFTTAIGSDLNSGHSPSQPMRTLAALLAAYDFEPGDVIHVDTGNYVLQGNITLDASDSGVRIEGPQGPTLLATFDRASASNPVFDLNGIDNLTLDHLRMTGAKDGVTNLTSANISDNVVVSNCELFGNANAGVYLIGGTTNFTLTGSVVRNNFYGLYFSNNLTTVTVTGNTFNNNTANAVLVAADGGLIDGNTVFGNGAFNGGALQASGFNHLITISNNIVHDNPRGITAGNWTLTTGNTVYASTDSGQGYGIIGSNTYNNTITNNVVYGAYRGISGGGLVSNNRVYGNTVFGLEVFSGETATGNYIYNNGVGVLGSGSFSNPIVKNNLIYNNATAGIRIQATYTPQILNNTIYQPTGDGIRLEGYSIGVTRTIRNNIIQVNSGYGIWLDQELISNLDSDYNTIFATGTGKLIRASGQDFASLAQWFYESRQDRNSLTGDPLFVDPDGADNLLGYSGGVDHGVDDNFGVQPLSQTIDAGDPSVWNLVEPAPNGGRINQGHTGNTSQAATSISQLIQLTSPNGFDKLEAGSSYAINWRSDGLTTTRTVARLNVSSRPNGAGLADWTQADQYGVVVPNSSWISSAINTSGVTNPGPQDMYQTFAYANSGIGNLLSYKLPLADGSYTLRLHWAEPFYAAGQRLFDIRINGVVAQTDFDVAAAAGNVLNKAVALSIPATATGGNGVLIELVNKTSQPAFLCGMEVTAANPGGFASPTATLEYSVNNGGSWLPIAAGLTMDSVGRGSYNWTVPANLSDQVLVRVRADQGSQPTDASSNKLQIVNNGIHYYVNDASLSGDTFTTSIGDNLNSGKSPDKPMASLYALLYDYDLDPGDVIHVDAGTYNLLRNNTLLADDSGVVIQGPASGAPATLNRGAQALQYQDVFQFLGADNVTIERLTMLNAYAGVDFGGFNVTADSDNNLIRNNDISQVAIWGIYSLNAADENNTISGNTIHDLAWGQAYGIQANGAGTAITGNTISNIGGYGIGLSGLNSVASGNTLFGNRLGILVSNVGVQIIGNTVRNSTDTGIQAGSFASSLVSGNDVYANPTGIITSGTPLVNNRVFGNTNYGIDASGSGTEIRGNQIYSNATGLRFSGPWGQLYSNLVYANTTRAVSIEATSTTAASPLRIWNNTIYSIVGDAIRLANSSNVSIYNNILWTNAASSIFVADATSQTGLVSDRNLFNGTGNVGTWNGVARATLADWQAASSRDATSSFGDPLFVDRDGADNLLGYVAGVDRGKDDNFFLSRLSPAIDRGHSWNLSRVDFYGGARVDDPGTANSGTSNYVPNAGGSSLFAATGTAQNWRSGNTHFGALNIGFSFPYFGNNYTTIYVGSNGLISLGTVPLGLHPVFDANNSLAQFANYAIIAPLWDALNTFANAADNIFVNSSIPNQLMIRWNATNTADGSDAQFDAVLFSDGTIRFDYGPGNTNLTPTVGISSGNGQAYTLAGYDGQAVLTNANSVTFNVAAGFTDLGAIEFRGTSADVTPPTVSSTNPVQIHTGGSVGTPTTQILVNFTESLNRIDAAAPANYDLRAAGPDLTFDTGDDIVVPFTLNYTDGNSFITMLLGSTPLANGTYRLTIKSNPADNTGLHDRAGILLDGDANATAGGNYVRTFVIGGGDTTPPTVLGGTYNFSSPPPSVALQFSENVAASLTTSDLVLQNLTTSATIPTANLQLSYNGANDTATVTFINYQNGILPDGNYRLTLPAGSITDVAGNPLALPFSFDFFVLAGDFNRDRVVDISDLAALATNWQLTGRTYAQGDSNLDGIVDITDLAALATNWQKSLPAPGSPIKAPVRRPIVRPVDLIRQVDPTIADDIEHSTHVELG